MVVINVNTEREFCRVVDNMTWATEFGIHKKVGT
jgi:hypothetical protein